MNQINVTSTVANNQGNQMPPYVRSRIMHRSELGLPLPAYTPKEGDAAMEKKNEHKIALDSRQSEIFRSNIKIAVYEQLLEQGLITIIQFNLLCQGIVKKGKIK